VTASVTDLAPVITIEAPRLPAEARRGELRRLACEVLENAQPSPYVLRLALRALVHPSISFAAVPVLWVDYLDAMRLAEDTDTGFVTWQEVMPELCGGERQETVREITRAGARAALDVLVHGERNRGGQ
jgi:hypothetical protein